MAVPLYTSYGQLLIDVKVPQLATEQWREAGSALDSAQIDSQIAVLRSEPVALAVVRRLDLMSDPAFMASIPVASAPETQPSSATAPADGGRQTEAEEQAEEERRMAAAGKVQSGLGIRRLGFAYVLEISYTAADPAFAARLANAYMQAYIDDQISVRSETARQGSEWLEKRINALRIQMNEASLKVQEFKARRDYSIVGRGSEGKGAAEAKDSTGKGLTETLEELDATALTYRRMFESALQAYTEAEQRQSYAVSSARIIASASRMVGKSYPKRKQTLAVGAIAGMMLGFGIAFLREGWLFAGATRTRRKTLQDAR
jgi:uncharacterized protein involved in exopolysaccharide biosynthesis